MSATWGLVTLLMFVAVAVSERRCTDENEISCSTDADRCIPYRYICDSDPDCGSSGEDEDGDLCAAWKNDCTRGEVKCRRNGDESCVSIQEYCVADSNCVGDLDPRICQMIQDGEVKPLASIILRQQQKFGDFEESALLAKEFVLILNHTMEHPSCPKMFTLVDDQCLALFFVGSVSWGEARAFCQMMDGDLVAFKDITHYTSVVTHLKEAQLTADFWIGGNLADESDVWRWVDDSAVEMGTPFWAVRYNKTCFLRNVTFPELNHTREANDGTCYHYLQAPESPPRGRCLALHYEHYYYMSDENCLQKKSPLCVLTDGDYEPDQE